MNQILGGTAISIAQKRSPPKWEAFLYIVRMEGHEPPRLSKPESKFHTTRNLYLIYNCDFILLTLNQTTSTNKKY